MVIKGHLPNLASFLDLVGYVSKFGNFQINPVVDTCQEKSEHIDTCQWLESRVSSLHMGSIYAHVHT